jgi:hypothetical protein
MLDARRATMLFSTGQSARAFPPKCSRQPGKTRQVQCQNDGDSVPRLSDLSASSLSVTKIDFLCEIILLTPRGRSPQVHVKW